jgi:hypothetical protein
MTLWHPIVRAVDDKHVQIAAIHPYLAICLFELPEILNRRDQPSAHDRMFPPLKRDDEKTNKEWHEMVGPDLRHLFVSAGETVTRDLTGLREDPLRAKHLQVMFPAEHLSSWMSAINEARLILGAVHQVTEDDMNDPSPDTNDPKTLAIVKIHVLGELMAHLVDFVDGHHAKPKRKRAPQPPRSDTPQTE